MLTIEVKLNGRLVGQARLVNQTNLSAISDYSLEWFEAGGDEFLPEGKAAGRTVITGHRRKSGVWPLVAKAAAAILGQKIDALERKR